MGGRNLLIKYPLKLNGTLRYNMRISYKSFGHHNEQTSLIGNYLDQLMHFPLPQLLRIIYRPSYWNTFLFSYWERSPSCPLFCIKSIKAFSNSTGTESPELILSWGQRVLVNSCTLFQKIFQTDARHLFRLASSKTYFSNLLSEYKNTNKID